VHVCAGPIFVCRLESEGKTVSTSSRDVTERAPKGFFSGIGESSSPGAFPGLNVFLLQIGRMG
jgi:hypothetical protein